MELKERVVYLETLVSVAGLVVRVSLAGLGFRVRMERLVCPVYPALMGDQAGRENLAGQDYPGHRAQKVSVVLTEVPDVTVFLAVQAFPVEMEGQAKRELEEETVLTVVLVPPGRKVREDSVADRVLRVCRAKMVSREAQG